MYLLSQMSDYSTWQWAVVVAENIVMLAAGGLGTVPWFSRSVKGDYRSLVWSYQGSLNRCMGVWWRILPSKRARCWLLYIYITFAHTILFTPFCSFLVYNRHCSFPFYQLAHVEDGFFLHSRECWRCQVSESSSFHPCLQHCDLADFPNHLLWNHWWLDPAWGFGATMVLAGLVRGLQTVSIFFLKHVWCKKSGWKDSYISIYRLDWWGGILRQDIALCIVTNCSEAVYPSDDSSL